MPDPFKIKAHDRKPSVTVRLGYDGTVNPPDLTGCTTRFIMRKAVPVLGDDGTLSWIADTTPATVKAQATVTDPATGTLRYDWQPGDTDLPGTYLVEWQVTDPAGLDQTFPTDSYNLLVIYADLDDAA